MKSPMDIATDYLAAWNEASQDERLRRLDAWSVDVRYRDPLMQADGREGVAAMIEGARAQFPGHEFTLHGTPDGHGAFVRFSWSLARDPSRPVAFGMDVIRLDASGRIAEVIGFLDGAGS